MVKHSLWKMLDKYPYFMDKRRISNLYKVTKVNNSVFRDLYNSIFHTYQSFHLDKRLLTWKTQDKPYSYQIHFCCGYPNIKTVKIYKNDILIHQDDFTEEEATKRTEQNQTYCWEYDCSYVKTNMLPIKVYRCTNCDTIYFGDELPYDCVGDGCNSNSYITTNIYECDECGEIYFDNPDSNGNVNIDCKNECNSTFTRLYAYRCMGYNESVVEIDEEEIEGMGSNGIHHDCGELYLGTEPPEVCTVCGASGVSEDTSVYYNDDTLMIIDNSTDFPSIKEVEMDSDIEINHIDDSVLVNTGKKLFVQVKDTADNYLKDVSVKLYSNYVENTTKVTDSSGLVKFDIDITKKYNKIDVFKEGFVSFQGESNPSYTIDLDYINDNYIITITLIKANVYNKLNTYEDEGEEYSLRVTNLEEGIGSVESFRIPLPVIPDDKFLFYVETWDEYWITKGFPENDEYLNDYYDHDYSLDEFGALNNIPRKKYVNVNDNNLYPLTEPPYNKELTEDDYHYMKRMIEYNIRLWIALLKMDNSNGDYDNYLDLLSKLGINEDDYNFYKNNTRSFRERYNPVTLELWKNYSIPSRLINRERYLLKLFDLRVHNSEYVPYKVDSDGKPIKKYQKWELDSDGNPLNDSVGTYIYKDKWDVVTDLSECWIPEKWEHKDKFCDGSILYKTYLFVEPETLRPLPYENVYCKFKLLNSLAEEVEEDYYVVLQVYYDDKSEIEYVDGEKISDGWCNLSYKMLSNSKPTTVVFNAYYSYEDYLENGVEPFSSVEIVFNPRNSCNADFYVDSGNTSGKEDGSKEYPFKTLQQALDKVNPNFDLICLKSNLTIEEPLFVPNKCRILGVRERNSDTECDLEKGVVNVPVITNTTSKKFFSLIGSKNCSLKLIDLRLKYKLINSYIGLGTWENHNKNLDDYEYVIINGGLVKINVSLNKDEYYPTDIIKVRITLTDKNNNHVTNQKVKLVLENGEPIILEDTDGDGIFEHTLRINGTERKIVNLMTSLISDIYFESSVLTKINCTKEPKTYVSGGEDVNINIETDSSNTPIKVYVDGEYVEEIFTDNGGKINYIYTPLDWGIHILLFIKNDDDVIEMVVVETKTTITKLIGTTFIKNFDININGDITYDKLTVTENMKLEDLDEVLINLRLDGNIVKSELFNVNPSRKDSTEIIASDCLILKNAVTNFTYENNTNIKYTILGEFWRD